VEIEVWNIDTGAETDLDQSVKQWESGFRKWQRRTVVLGIALIASVAVVVPFLAGHSLHEYWDQGKYLIWVAWVVLSLFAISAGTAYSFWQGWRSIRSEVADYYNGPR
jgi:membrane protease YdiL (CAAX protease family)